MRGVIDGLIRERRLGAAVTLPDVLERARLIEGRVDDEPAPTLHRRQGVLHNRSLGVLGSAPPRRFGAQGFPVSSVVFLLRSAVTIPV